MMRPIWNVAMICIAFSRLSIAVALSSLLFTGCPSNRVADPTEVPALSPAAPEIVFLEPKFNVGKGQRGEVKEHDFAFRNAGDASLRIRKIVTKCGCVAVTSSADETPPGGAGEIHVGLTLKRGDTEQEVYVLTNDPKHEIVTLTIQGTGQVKYDLDLAPQEIRLGTVKSGTVATRSAVLNNFVGDASEAAKSVAFTTSAPGIQVTRKSEWKESSTQTEERSFRRSMEFDIEVKAPETTGIFHGFVEAAVQFDSEVKRMRLPVVAQVESPIRIEPTRVFLDPVSLGSTLEFSVAVSDSSSRALTRIEATNTVGDSIQLISTDVSPDGLLLHFRFVPESVGVVAGEINVKLPDLSDSVLRVPFGVEVRKEDARS